MHPPTELSDLFDFCHREVDWNLRKLASPRWLSRLDIELIAVESIGEVFQKMFVGDEVYDGSPRKVVVQYCCKVAHSRLLDEIRRLQRVKRRVESCNDWDFEGCIDVRSRNPGEDIEESEWIEIFIRRLPNARLKEILRLRCEGLCPREIGKQLGVSRRTVERECTTIKAYFHLYYNLG